MRWCRDNGRPLTDQQQHAGRGEGHGDENEQEHAESAGNARANTMAEATLAEVREHMGMGYANG
ncbi:hypothetical protein ACTJJ4_16070 [Microbacterium sp. 22195]|uniref:hypothetical protein n=1 Tax=Microbacterium sp. 22195 TaxID=3453891 RepID=UPI003F87D151